MGIFAMGVGGPGNPAPIQPSGKGDRMLLPQFQVSGSKFHVGLDFGRTWNVETWNLKLAWNLDPRNRRRPSVRRVSAAAAESARLCRAVPARRPSEPPAR